MIYLLKKVGKRVTKMKEKTIKEETKCLGLLVSLVLEFETLLKLDWFFAGNTNLAAILLFTNNTRTTHPSNHLERLILFDYGHNSKSYTCTKTIGSWVTVHTCDTLHLACKGVTYICSMHHSNFCFDLFLGRQSAAPTLKQTVVD